MLNNLEIPNEALTETVKSTDKHLGETYDNVVNLPTKAIGYGLSSIINLVFSPFKYLNDKSSLSFQHKLRIYEKELEEKEKSIPEDKKVEPDFHSVSLALDNSKFCITNDVLRMMFVNLIGNSMHSDKKDMAHPAFAEIIKQMCTLDAMILTTFKNDAVQPIINIMKSNSDKSTTMLYRDLFFAFIENIPYSYELFSMSISNLNHLGLVKIDYTVSLHHKKLYDELKAISSEIISYSMDEIKFTEGIVTLTPLGNKFVSVCLSD